MSVEFWGCLYALTPLVAFPAVLLFLQITGGYIAID